MVKIGQNLKIGQLWRPVASQPYIAQESWPISETPWPLDYNVEYTQYLSAVHPVICSVLWVRCLFDLLAISDFGGKWPLKLKFSKMSFRIHRRDTKLRFVAKFGKNWPLRTCRNVVWITTQKTRALWDSSQPPFCPKWADRAQNFLNVVTPWPVHVDRIWSGSTALCRTYSGKIDFSDRKVNTIYAYTQIQLVSLYKLLE